MTNPAPSDEDLSEAVRLYEEHGSKQAAADAAGLPVSTFKDRLRRAATRGLMLNHKPAMPGFRITRVNDGPAGKSVEQKPEHGGAFELPPGHIIKGVSSLLNADGEKIVEWVKTTVSPTVQDTIGALLGAFADVKPAKPIRAPSFVQDDFVSLTAANDWHLNMFAWGRETPQPGRDTNWDLKIAEQVIGDATCAVVDRSRPSALAILLGGGDLSHADNKENKTARSGNVLDCDGRYQKTVQVACRLKVRVIDAHLIKHGRVLVRILPGNHDEHFAVAIAYYLSAYYRNEPRVTVDLDPSLYFWYRFGKVMLGATHGHTVPLQKMPMIMANRRPEDWGATQHRYVHGFHIHHKTQYGFEADGCYMESHQAPIPSDGWHYSKGYITGQSIQSICYHREVGEYGRSREPIILLPNASNDNAPVRLTVAA